MIFHHMKFFYKIFPLLSKVQCVSAGRRQPQPYASAARAHVTEDLKIVTHSEWTCPAALITVNTRKDYLHIFETLICLKTVFNVSHIYSQELVFFFNVNKVLSIFERFLHVPYSQYSSRRRYFFTTQTEVLIFIKMHFQENSIYYLKSKWTGQ